MRYYLEERRTNQGPVKNAGGKARLDVNQILKQSDWKPIEVQIPETKSQNIFSKLLGHFRNYFVLKTKLSNLKKGDCILLQMPILTHSIFHNNCIKQARRKGVEFIILIHDLDMLRLGFDRNHSKLESIRISLEEKKVLNLGNYIIAHNEKMISLLTSMGISNDRLINLELFDYLIPGYDKLDLKEHFAKILPIVIAGNLQISKAGYIEFLPKDVQFNLYGSHCEISSTQLNYFGSFESEKLPEVVSGSFGLVWDGQTTDSCTGIYGEYLKVNNPHKMSLYLSLGMPVIIWAKAANAKFVSDNNCGVVVDSLDNLGELLRNISEEDYMKMRENSIKLSQKVRSGFFLLKALQMIDVKKT